MNRQRWPTDNANGDNAATLERNSPLVDRLFGTFKLPHTEWPKRYGVFGKELPGGMLKQLVYPLKKKEPVR
jgi:lathosterol oxidase